MLKTGVNASLDGELRHAYELVTERLREENHAEVSWEQAVQVSKMLVELDLVMLALPWKEDFPRKC